MLKENEAIYPEDQSRSDGVKEEKGIIESG